jgi:hypothetical protein
VGFPPVAAGDAIASATRWDPPSAALNCHRTPGSLRYRVFVASIKQPGEAPKGPRAAAEAARLQRLRDDARRPMSVNLAEGIALSHELMQFVGTARPN